MLFRLLIKKLKIKVKLIKYSFPYYLICFEKSVIGYFSTHGYTVDSVTPFFNLSVSCMWMCYVNRLISAGLMWMFFSVLNSCGNPICFLSAKPTVKIHLFRLHRDYTGVG